MKTLILGLLVSINLWSQVYDGFHRNEQRKQCSREACLIVDGIEIGFYEFVDRDGYSFLNLNTKAAIDDIDFDNACFNGDATEVASIITAIAGNTDSSFANGGHSRIEDIKINYENDLVNASILIKSDYSINLDEMKLNIKRCH